MRRLFDERDGWPVVTVDDWLSGLGLLVFAVIFVALCAVGQ